MIKSINDIVELKQKIIINLDNTNKLIEQNKNNIDMLNMLRGKKELLQQALKSILKTLEQAQKINLGI